MTHEMGVDVGGTFTDFVSIDERRRVSVFKSLTTPEDPSEAVLRGTVDFAASRQDKPSEARRIVHGTTLVANSLIERRGARTALVTTTGFRDVIELGREARYDIYDLALERPEPLVPRPLRFEISERILADGTVLAPLAEDEARTIARRLRELEIESVAIVLLHAYANPAHERRLAAILAEEVPGLDLTLSSEIAPEWREYERSSTTAANAFVRPLLRRYLTRLERGFAAMGAPDRLFVMMSQGGLTSAALAGEHAVRLVESGPVGGVLAAGFFGRRAGLSDMIAFDMGGTTSKISLIEAGEPLKVTELEVARAARFKRGSGLPLKVPSVELIEIGAGGGSIGRRDAMGLMKVGPQSAAAVPGPACYGRGGTQATVTDADLQLGLINPAYFLGGKMSLRSDLAETALAELGAAFGYGATRCAAGMLEIVNRQMALAMRTHVVERGHDPRRFTLIATGGAGPVHAYEVARHLGIKRILYPPAAGVASSLGFLVAPISIDLVRTFRSVLGSMHWEAVLLRYRDMEEEARGWLRRVNSDSGAAHFVRRVDMRYTGQGYEVPIELPNGKLDEGIEAELRVSFDAAYRRRFGTSLSTAPAEALHWRLEVSLGAPELELAFAAPEQGSSLKATRQAWFAELGEFRACPVHDRYRLGPGSEIIGPALIEERELTIVVGPSAAATVDAAGNVILTFHREAS